MTYPHFKPKKENTHKVQLHTNEAQRRAHQRREELRDLFIQLGGVGLPVKGLAERYNVSTRKIYDDLEKIKRELPKPNIDEVLQSWNLQFDNVMRKMSAILNTGNKSEQINASRVIVETIKKHGDLLKTMGLLAPDEPTTQVNIATTGDVSFLPEKIVFIEKQQNIVLPKETEVDGMEVLSNLSAEQKK